LFGVYSIIGNASLNNGFHLLYIITSVIVLILNSGSILTSTSIYTINNVFWINDLTFWIRVGSLIEHSKELGYDKLSECFNLLLS